MSGETDLDRLLATLDPVVRSGEFVFVTSPVHLPGAAATIVEDEGITHVVTRADADGNGWPYEYVAAWITLRVQSSLAAVGMTAAVSRALADVGISCNVLAAYHHDHLLVPRDRVPDALDALGRLRTVPRAGPT